MPVRPTSWHRLDARAPRYSVKGSKRWRVDQNPARSEVKAPISPTRARPTGAIAYCPATWWNKYQSKGVSRRTDEIGSSASSIHSANPALIVYSQLLWDSGRRRSAFINKTDRFPCSAKAVARFRAVGAFPPGHSRRRSEGDPQLARFCQLSQAHAQIPVPVRAGAASVRVEDQPALGQKLYLFGPVSIQDSAPRRGDPAR